MPEESKVLTFNRGVNRTVDPLRLGDDEACTLQNLYPDLSGKLNKRWGPTFAGALPDPVWTEGGVVDPQYLIPLNISFPPYVSSGFIFVGYDSANDRSFVKVTNGTGTTEMVFTTLSGFRPQIIHFGGISLILTGKPQADPDPALDGWSIIVVITVGGQLKLTRSLLRFYTAGPTYLAPHMAGVYRGRVVWGDFDGEFKTTLLVSDAGDYTGLISPMPGPGVAVRDVDLDNSAMTIEVPETEGDRLVACAEVALAAAADGLHSALFVLTEQQAKMMVGEPEETSGIGPDYTGGATWIHYPVTCGCASRETVVRTPFGLVWANWNEVWGVQPGGLPQRLGTKLRTELASDDPTGRFLWHAVYHHETGTYRLAINAGPAPYGAYPSCIDQWWLDLRNGMQSPVWYGPQAYRMCSAVLADPTALGTYIMVTDSRAGQNNRVVACHRAFWDGSTTFSGSPTHIVLLEMDTQEGFDGAINSGLPSEQGNQIQASVVSKTFDFRDPFHDKLYLGTEIQVRSDDLTALDVTISADGGRTSDTETVVLPKKVGSEEYQSILANPDSTNRINGKTLKLTVSDKPGYYVPTEGVGSSLIFRARQVGDPTHYWPYYVTLTPGFYATRAAYLTMLCARMTLALGTEGFAFTEETSGYVTITGSTNLPEDHMWGPGYSDADPSLGASSLYVWELLGFDSAVQVDPVVGGLTGNNVTAKKLSPSLDLATLLLKAYHYGRRPSGPRDEKQIP